MSVTRILLEIPSELRAYMDVDGLSVVRPVPINQLRPLASESEAPGLANLMSFTLQGLLHYLHGT